MIELVGLAIVIPVGKLHGNAKDTKSFCGADRLTSKGY